MDLLVYSAPWCPDCRTAKRFLEKHGISYKEIDIETTPGAADEVIRQTGKRAIPQFVLNGEWVALPSGTRLPLRRDEPVVGHLELGASRIILDLSEGSHDTRASSSMHDPDHPQRLFIRRVGNQIFSNQGEAQRPVR